MTEFDPNEFIQDQINAALNKIHDGIEAGCDDLLREAYEAGYARGYDDRTDEQWGPPYSDEPTYEMWRDALLERNRS